MLQNLSVSTGTDVAAVCACACVHTGRKADFAAKSVCLQIHSASQGCGILSMFDFSESPFPHLKTCNQ